MIARTLTDLHAMNEFHTSIDTHCAAITALLNDQDRSRAERRRQLGEAFEKMDAVIVETMRKCGIEPTKGEPL